MVAGKAGFNEADDSTAPREPREQLIYIKNSDGSIDHRPSTDQLDRSVRGGRVNYFRQVYLNEPAAASWRKKIGEALAGDLGYDTKTKVWYLAAWPKDYALFVQCNGEQHDPRCDLYLYGNGTKFRSANEFIPHARWLISDNENVNCQCKYCGNTKSQRLINWREGLPGAAAVLERHAGDRTSTSVGPTNVASRTHLRRAAAEPRKLKPEEQFVPVSKYLENDLRTRRPFRTGEIVWVRIDPPIVSDASSSSMERKIDWWPAAIQEPRYKSIVEPHAHLPSQPYNVLQVSVYRLIMLGTTSQYVVPESQLLPYRAYVVPDFVDSMARPTPSNFNRYASFAPLPNPLQVSRAVIQGDPPPPPPPRTFEDAIFPYLVAVYMSRHVSGSWCLTDPWDFVTDPSLESTIVKQDRFQGLWWGPERLWMGDLVRLKAARNHLEGDLLPPSKGAEQRAVMLKIMNIYLEVVQGDDDMQWKPMVAGTLYELELDDPDSSTWPPPEEVLTGAAQYDPTNTPLPPPPPGYRFRPITPSLDDDAHVTLDSIAGRYYPTLLSSPLLLVVSNITTFAPHGSSSLVPSFPPRLMSLSGLAPGWMNAVEMREWMHGRVAMLQSGQKEALAELGVVPPASSPETPKLVRKPSIDSLFDADSDGDSVMAGL